MLATVNLSHHRTVKLLWQPNLLELHNLLSKILALEILASRHKYKGHIIMCASRCILDVASNQEAK